MIHLKKYKLIIFLVLIAGIAGMATSSCKQHGDSAQESLPTTYLIAYHTIVETEGLKSESNMTQWIDNELKMYAIETKTISEIHGKKHQGSSLMIMKEGWSYVINLDQKTGFRMQADTNNVITKAYLRPSGEEALRQQILKEGGQFVGHETQLGFTCNVVSLMEPDENGKPAETRYWYYRGIPLRIENTLMNMVAVRFETPLKSGPEVFQVPDNIIISNVSY